MRFRNAPSGRILRGQKGDLLGFGAGGMLQAMPGLIILNTDPAGVSVPNASTATIPFTGSSDPDTIPVVDGVAYLPPNVAALFFLRGRFGSSGVGNREFGIRNLTPVFLTTVGSQLPPSSGQCTMSGLTTYGSDLTEPTGFQLFGFQNSGGALLATQWTLAVWIYRKNVVQT